MVHRTVTFCAVVTALCVFTNTPFVSAAFPSGRLLEARKARLQRLRPFHKAAPLRKRSSSSVSSSSSSRSQGLLSLQKRRGGGGSGGRPAGSGDEGLLITPTISFPDITKNYGDSSFTLSPTSNSNGPITFTSGNPSVASISGNVVTLGTVGTATITLAQGAIGNYAGTTTTAVITVQPIAPTIVALISITKTSTDPPFVLADPMSNSAGAFTFTSTNTAVATIVGRTVTIRGAGTTTIISTQAASGNYASGSATTLLTVNPDLSEA